MGICRPVWPGFLAALGCAQAYVHPLPRSVFWGLRRALGRGGSPGLLVRRRAAVREGLETCLVAALNGIALSQLLRVEPLPRLRVCVFWRGDVVVGRPYVRRSVAGLWCADTCRILGCHVNRQSVFARMSKNGSLGWFAGMLGRSSSHGVLLRNLGRFVGLRCVPSTLMPYTVPRLCGFCSDNTLCVFYMSNKLDKNCIAVAGARLRNQSHRTKTCRHCIGMLLQPLGGALYIRGRHVWKIWCFIWKKNLTHMLYLNSHFFQLIGRFLMPIPSSRLHSAFGLCLRTRHPHQILLSLLLGVGGMGGSP